MERKIWTRIIFSETQFVLEHYISLSRPENRSFLSRPKIKISLDFAPYDYDSSSVTRQRKYVLQTTFFQLDNFQFIHNRLTNFSFTKFQNDEYLLKKSQYLILNLSSFKNGQFITTGVNHPVYAAIYTLGSRHNKCLFLNSVFRLFGESSKKDRNQEDNISCFLALMRLACNLVILSYKYLLLL